MTNSLIIEDLTLVSVPGWWRDPWIWCAIAAAAAIGFACIRYWLRRPVLLAPTAPLPASDPPPHAEALRRLRALRERHGTLGPYEVAVECSDILRVFVEGRFGLPIRYQTTREFLGAAQAQPELGPDPRRELGEFLRFFDRLKFARDDASAAETLAAIDGAIRFVYCCFPAATATPAA